MENFDQHYLLLDAQPDMSWEQIRNAYKAQIRLWHPDRHEHDEARRCLAEERTKLINQAYQALHEYYELHGTLPSPHRPPEVVQDVRAQHGTPESATTTHRRPPPYRPAGSRHENWPVDAPAEIRKSRLAILAASLLLIVIFSQTGPSLEQDLVASSDAPVARQPRSPGNKALPDNHEAAGVTGTEHAKPIYIGAAIGEVYDSLGVPDRIAGDTWYYGEAQIHFVNGRVAQLKDTIPPRLLAGHPGSRSTLANNIPITFGYGSSKEEVRAAQGTPMRESEREWDYGISRVYFDRDGRVTGWRESPLNPLMLKR